MAFTRRPAKGAKYEERGNSLSMNFRAARELLLTVIFDYILQHRTIVVGMFHVARTFTGNTHQLMLTVGSAAIRKKKLFA